MMTEAVVRGAGHPDLAGVNTRAVAALDATVDDALGADGFIFGTPANLGYMSGALKHFFDQTYNSLLGSSRGRPCGMYVHGESDTHGALQALAKIATGLALRMATEPLSCIGPLRDADIAACEELGAVVAANLLD